MIKYDGMDIFVALLALLMLELQMLVASLQLLNKGMGQIFDWADKD